MWKKSLSLLLFAFALTGCKSVEIGDEVAETPYFQDAFERSALGPNWKRGVGEAGTGQWVIKDGAVEGRGLKNDPLWFTKPLPENARVRFDATALSAEGDLKVEIFGDGTNHASGYVVIFGGWKNSLDVIARLDEHGKDRLAKKSVRVEPKKTYAFEVRRTAKGELVWKLDGKEILRYEDKKPLSGDKHAYFAFSNWNAPVRFDNFKVFSN